MSADILPPQMVNVPLAANPSHVLPPAPTTPTRRRNAAASGSTPVTPTTASPRTSSRLRDKRHGPDSPSVQQTPAPAPAPAPVVPVVDPGPEYLQPAEFSPLNNNALKVVVMPGQYLSPEDDKLATRGIPIFRPTLEEFEDFEGYVTRTVAWGQYSGIVKVIPPEGWKKTLPPIPSSALADVRIKTPIQQNMLGQAGLFRAQNVEKNKNRPLSIQEWFNKSMDKRFAGPGPKDLDPTLDRDSAAWKQRREEAIKEAKRKKDEAREKRLAAAARKQQRMAAAHANGPLSIEAEESALNGEVEDKESEHVHPDFAADVPPLDPSGHSPPSSNGDMAKTPESDPDPVPEWYRHFDPSTAWLPKDTKPEDYTPEACANMERKFWKTMGLGEPSWYGADLQGTLFPDPETKWNVAHLPNLLNRLGRELPGVNRPYLYFGMWRAAFAWHVEDMDLFSINYIHFGAPKFWYAIPQGQAEAFERIITSYFPREATECDQFLRHKAYLMSPTRLAKDGIHVNELVHNQGEFVITYPRGYHAGFNMGFNCAESVNFALDSWVELGRRAKVCQCVSHSVRIDMDELLGQSEYAKQQAALQAQEDILNAFEAERTGKNRKRSLAPGDVPRKRARVQPTIFGEEEEDSGPEVKPTLPVVAGLEKKKKSIPLDKKPRPPTIVKAPTVFPCILCPDTSTEGLIPVHEPPESVVAMCKSADGVVRAHSVCVSSVPEVWVEDVEQGGRTAEVVRGVEGINKARWSLKCGSCRDKKLAAMGAKVQCVNGKCPKAFHVTCARDDEQVVYRVWEAEEYQPIPIPDDAPPGTQHEFTKVTTLKTEILCPNHNPEVKEAKKAQAARELKDKVMSLLAGQNVKVKTSRGVFEVKLVSVLEQEQKAEVEHDSGQRSFVKWTEIDFRPAVERRVENEYAKDYVTRRTETGEVVQIGTHSQASSPAPTRIPSARSTPVKVAPPPVQRVAKHQVAPARQAPRPESHAPSHDFRHIPSRVVVCDSDYRHPQYAYPPGYLPPPVQAMPPGFPHAWQGYHPGRPQPIHVPHPQGYPVPVYPGYPPAPTQHLHPQGYHVHSAGHSSTPTATPPSGSSRSTPASSNGMNGRPSSSLSQHGSSGVGRIGLGLERMSALMRALPPLRVPAIHLAGTNGKGSVSAILESVLRTAGLTVGRYNSPHLLEPRDAIALDGVPPSREAYAMAIARVSSANDQLKLSATTFELATAAAFDLINAHRPDVMIIECGMGGESDATNVIPPELILASALTSVGLDHTAFLGDTIEAITKVKSGIAVPDGLLVVGPQTYNGVARIAGEVAGTRGARTVYTDRPLVISPPPSRLSGVSDLKSLPYRVIRVTTPEGVIDAQLGLAGDHQLDNASLAINILSVIREDPRARRIQPKIASLSDEIISRGVASARWPGRCELIRYPCPNGDMPVLVDGAHNADSASMLSSTIRSLGLPRDTRVTWIIGLSDSKGKTPESVLKPLIRPHDNVLAVPFSRVEGMPWVQPVAPSTVASISQRLSEGGRKEIRDNVREALGAVAPLGEKERGLVVVCGSLYLVADFFRLAGIGL